MAEGTSAFRSGFGTAPQSPRVIGLCALAPVTRGVVAFATPGARFGGTIGNWMTEREIRERIEGFLRRTAEVVVVPATMGLGLSQAGCDHHSLGTRPADAAAEVQRQDAAVRSDLAEPPPPYLVIQLADAADSSSILPDAGVDLVPDTRADAESEAGVSLDVGEEIPRRTDVSPDIAFPPPPYLMPPPPDAPSSQPDARPDLAPPDLLAPPPPPYMVPPLDPPPTSPSKR